MKNKVIAFWVMKMFRYGIAAGGGWLVSQGYANDVQSEQLMGAGGVAVSLIWSAIQSATRISSGNERID